MEQIIRPFETLDPTRKVSVSVSPTGTLPTQQTAALCWGAAGQIPKSVIQADNFDGINFRVEECDNNLAENSRDTENVRVENPNDSQQYVIVQRIRRIDFKKAAKGAFDDATTKALDAYLQAEFWGNSSFGPNAQQDRCKDNFFMNR